jgi:prolyl-tRNA editing enzyme YbaK/EbsC (Cys-tRNA(Pro) deacylase)
VTAVLKSASDAFSHADEFAPVCANDLARAPLIAQRVLKTFDQLGLPYGVTLLESTPETPEALASALRTVPDDIVLSTMYRGKATRKPILLLHAAASRVSDKLLCNLVGENVQRADNEFTERYTGFPAAHVPPAGHLNRVPLLLDSTLIRVARVWCSIGAPGCYAQVPSLVLVRAISARLVNLGN